MAQQVQIPGASSAAKLRNPIAVAIFATITLGIYVLFWWYYANRELADYGRAKGTDELGDSPGKSLLAVFPGALVIVPAIWTTFTTFKRVQAAQKLAGRRTDQRLARVRHLHRVLARVRRVHAERAEQRVGGAARRLERAHRGAMPRAGRRGHAHQQHTARHEAEAEEHQHPERRSGERQRATGGRRGNAGGNRTALLVRVLRDAARRDLRIGHDPRDT